MGTWKHIEELDALQQHNLCFYQENNPLDM